MHRPPRLLCKSPSEFLEERASSLSSFSFAFAYSHPVSASHTSSIPPFLSSSVNQHEQRSTRINYPRRTRMAHVRKNFSPHLHVVTLVLVLDPVNNTDGMYTTNSPYLGSTTCTSRPADAYYSCHSRARTDASTKQNLLEKFQCKTAVKLEAGSTKNIQQLTTHDFLASSQLSSQYSR